MKATHTFRPLTADEEALWDAFVDASPQGNAFLLSQTLRTLARNEHPPARVHRVGAFTSDGTLDAAWGVLVRTRGPFRYATQFPLYYAGPLLSPEASAPKHQTHRIALLEGLARALFQDIDILETESAPELPDARGLIFAGCDVQQIYTHVWPAGSADDLAGWPNKPKRYEMRRAARAYQFRETPGTPETLARFDALHNRTLEKFKWKAPPHWRKALLTNMAEMESAGCCRLYAAAPEAAPDQPCAIVSILLSPVQQRAWLWRVAYDTDEPGLVPALYVEASKDLKTCGGPGWTLNFGGSPRPSLAAFKDHLGGLPTPHWRITWQRPGWRGQLWHLSKRVKETLRQTTYHVRATEPIAEKETAS